MLRTNTPVEDYIDEWGLMVKREDLSCPPPGPPFSKTRGVWAHIENITREQPNVRTIGVLDTGHSQAGHAVRAACLDYGLDTVNFYPVYKRTPHAVPEAVQKSKALGARAIGLSAGPSWYLYHQARWWMEAELPMGSWYLMPNALKLPEMVEETAEEVRQTIAHWPDFPAPEFVVIPASSATIAAGVMKGFRRHSPFGFVPHFIVHLGYSRSESAVNKGIATKIGSDFLGVKFTIVDEGYSYSDRAAPGPDPEWPCNPYYDLKAFRWFVRDGGEFNQVCPSLFWNIG